MESGNDYVIQVKGNQSGLLKALKQSIQNNEVVDMDYTLEKNRGRIEKREVHVYEAKGSKVYTAWKAITYVIQVVASGQRNGKQYKEDRYYITNKMMSVAKEYNLGIRNHWGIENKLHWVKDVILIEDGGLVRSIERCKNLTVIRNTIMNLFRINGYHSIKYAIEKFTNCIGDCLKLIHGNKHICKI